MRLSIDFLQETLGNARFFVGKSGVLQPYAENIPFIGINTLVSLAVDSTMLEPGEVFVALCGKKVDGHSFIGEALAKGASALLVSHTTWLATTSAELFENKLVIEVADTYAALLALARAWRAQFSIPIVGITGSIGKTTTKEMLRTILQVAGVPALVSLKNQNTVIGLCMNILKLHPEHQVAIFEVGISLRDEMDERAELLRPTLGVITLLANAHAEGLGGMQGICNEKRKLFNYFMPSAIGIINGDQELLAKAHFHHPIAKFGLKMSNQVQARKVNCVDALGQLQTSFMLKWYGQRAQVTLKGCHAGYVNNALAAATVAYFLTIPLAKVVEGLEAYRGFEHRFEIKELKDGRGRLISDCYNANPESMRMALQAFDVMQATGPKIAVLGDMLELGSREQYWHRQLGRFLRTIPSITMVILVGERARHAAFALPAFLEVIMVDDWQGAVQSLGPRLAHGSLVLVKASRGMNLNFLVSAVCKE